MNASPDLVSLVLTLRPNTQSDLEKPIPQWWGRSIHSLLLQTISQHDPTLADSLHAGQGPRPFTGSNLMGRFPNKQLDLEYYYTLRLTALQKEVSTTLLNAAKDGPLAPGATVELDHNPFTVERISINEASGDDAPESHETSTTEAHPQQPEISNPKSLIQIPSPWAATSTYQDLSAALLLAKEDAPKKIQLQFTSPTTFKSKGMHVPVPLPDLVFGSLLDRWNVFAPIAFPPETKRYASECLAVTRYRLSSRTARLKGTSLRVGAVGQITYTTLNYDRYWMSVIGVLAAFALYSGVGAGTTMGLGQCRMILDKKNR
jgi:CRISPR-associated endoribonuclease Cas6